MSRYFIILFVLILSSCNEREDVANYPECMQVTIDNYLNNYPEPMQKPASISKYSYQNKEVYVFDPGSGFSDFLFTVKDKDCNSVCEFGGIAGIQTCKDWENARLLGIVWIDKR